MLRRTIAIVLVATLPALPALAKPGNGKGGNSHGGQSHGNSGHGGSDNSGQGGSGNGDHGGGGGGAYDDDGPRFSSRDQNVWRSYWQDEYEHGDCPPGLAKKHNGCMPPGLAKKRYAVGRPLPSGVVVLPVPVALLPRLAPCPPGYRYGMVDGDLVKLAVGTMLVVDAINGLTH